MKRTITIAILAGLMAALCISSATAATIRVDGLNGVDDAQHNGSTWALAKSTIGAAVTAAAANDEVWVRGKGTVGGTTFDGVYLEQVTLNKVVKLYGGFLGNEATRSPRGFYPPFGPSQYLYETTIDGNNSGSVVTLQSGATTATIIDGFTIRNGSSYGVNCGTYSPQVTHNLIENNGGSGVYSSSGAPAVRYNLIQGNAGAGVSCGTYSSAIVSANIIRGNVEAGVSSASSGGITANFLSGNRTGGISISGSQVVDSNTIAGNSGQAMSSQFGSPTIRNNIVAYNAYGVNHIGTGTPSLTYNCVYGNAACQYAAGLTPGTGSISSDPKLGGVVYGELHIKSDSPCVNTAYIGGTPSVDIDGDYRPPILPRNIGADFFFPATPPTYDGNPTVIVMVDSGESGNDGNDGLSWGNPKKTIQAGIDAAARWGGDVWVETGTYDECIVLQSHAQVYGGFAGDETSREDRDWRTNVTTIDGASGELESLSAVYAQTGHLVSRIDGFTITNGKAQMGAGVLCYYASAYVSNNTIEDNGGAVTMTGGGYESYGSYSEVSNNIIRGNSATDYGSGIMSYNSADTFYNNLIYGNISGDVAGAVGIFANNLSPTLVNNTITDNENDGIYINEWDSPTQTGDIINNIVAGNSGYGIHSDGQIDPVLSHNDVPDDGLGDYEGISAGTGDISSDPLFADQQNGNYHIAETSPCVDTGYDSAVVSGSLDIDSEPRQVEIPDKGTAGTLVDIGADEWYPDYEEDPVVDNGLPTTNVNTAGISRSNIRWADSNSGIGYGGSFTFLEGPAWQIDEITVWTVPNMPMYPTYYLGDLYSNVALYLGTTTLGTGPVVSGAFTAGANTTNNNNINAEAAQYGGTTDYEDFDGTFNKLWKITFANVSWTAPANTEIHFGVHGTPRVDRLWFNHAIAVGEGSGTLCQFDTADNPVSWSSADGSGWFYGKDTSINIVVKAHPVLQ